MPHILILARTTCYGHYLGSLVEHRGLRYKLVLFNDPRLEEAFSWQPRIAVLEEDPPYEFLRRYKLRNQKTTLIVVNGSEAHRNSHQENCFFLFKPLDVCSFWKVLDNALNGTQRPQANILETLIPETLIIGTSQAVKNIRRDVARVGPTELPVLLLGDTGTGKGLVAFSLHKASQRRSNKFMEINCATIPVNLMESELFGYKQGAFTGAWRDKLGKFQLAEEGTVLLDEISELSPYMQAKLLQVIQEGEFSVVGGKENTKVNVRIIAACNTDLKKLISEKNFRSDLYYRLAVITLRLPTLKERKEDILPLSIYFRDKYANMYNKRNLVISDGMHQLLEIYDWPGNIRELENVIKSYVALESDKLIIDLLQKRIDAKQQATIEEISIPHRFNGTQDFSLKKLSDSVAENAEKKAIQKAIKATNGNKKKAAQLLKISYKCMLNKSKEYGI